MEKADIPEDELRRVYWDEGMSQKEAGAYFGVSAKTIHNRLKEYGIETRSQGHPRKVTGDEAELRRLYWGEGYTLEDMAEHYDATMAAVLRFMDRYGIERRDKGSGWRKNHAGRQVEDRGYVRYMVDGENNTKVYEHRIVAIGEYGLDALSEMDVHHKNGIPWDNRPENLELMTRSEHTKLHQNHAA